MRKIIYVIIFLSISLLINGALAAESMSGADYDVKEGTVSLAGPGASSSTYNLENIIGTDGTQEMSGTSYKLNSGFFGSNSLPVATINNYNNGSPITDETPTLSWIYSDADNDIQKRYQLQIGQGGFNTIAVDSGMISSPLTSFTSSILSQVGERTAYQWRVRVDDGFGWSGWTIASSGFVLTTGGFFISNLQALITPGGAVIISATWQTDNDPYFFWDAPAEGIEVLGYSYSLDELPDDVIDSTNTYYYFSQDEVSDGAHTFYVKAQRSSGVWGEAAGFSIWIDTLAPSVSTLAPALGGVIADDKVQVQAAFSDAASGVDPDTIVMRVNQSQVTPVYNVMDGTITFTPITPFSEGEVVISLEAADLVGNVATALIWSFIIDTEGPSGSIVINNNDELTTTNIVTLSISAEDDVSTVAYMMLSNDGIFDTENWESFTVLRKNWAMLPINGSRKVYIRLKDEGGNISEVFFDQINLVIIAPQTYILTGPSGITQVQDVQFTFRSSLSGSQFSYKFDDGEWSEWSANLIVNQSDLTEGNHYFMVKAAKDLNQDGILQLDEVDQTPALRVWTISITGVLKPPTEPEKPVKYRLEE